MKQYQEDSFCNVNAIHVHNVCDSEETTCISVNKIEIQVIQNNETIYEFNLSDYRLNCYNMGITPRF